MTSPFIPNSFTYGDAPQGGAVLPMIIAGRNPSNTTDSQYASGYWWLSDLAQGGSGNMYYQGGNSSGSPNWTLVSNSGGVLNTLSDGSTTVNPSGGNIAIVSTPNQITSTASAPSHEIILSIPGNFIAPGSIASTTTLTAGTTLTVTTDATIGDDLTVTDDASIGGDLTVTGSITMGSLTVNGTVAINTAGAGTTTIGSAAAGAIVIDVGTGNFALNGGGNLIDIGTDAAANTISIGNDNTTTGVTITAGTSDLLLTGAVTTAITIGDTLQTGLITLGRSTAGQDIDIGSAINASAQVIDIGNGASAANSTVRILSGTGTAGTGTLALGNNPRVTVAGMTDVAPAASRTTTIGGGTVVVAAVTDTIDIGPDGATTNANSVKTVNVNTGGVTLGQVLTNIATGAVTSGTHTTAIATGNRAAGTMAVNLLTGTGTKTFNLGNADGLTTSNVLGPFNLNVNQNNDVAINSGTSTGAITIGNTAAGAIVINSATTIAVGDASAGAITVDTAAGISLDAATASNFTVTGAANLTLESTLGQVIAQSAMAAVNAIRVNASDAAGGIDIDCGTGGITIDSTGGAFSIDGQANSNVTVTGAGVDLTLSSALGSVLVRSTEDAALAIRLHANGGVTETIQLHSDQGTSVGSINLLSDVGGITLTATGLASSDAINFEAPAGGIDMNGALEINIASSQAAATAINIIASDAGAGGITMAAGAGNVNITGAVIKVTNPAFLGYLAATVNNKTGTGTAYTLGTDALTQVFDRDGGFNTNGTFTAAVTGIYDLRACVNVSNCTIATTFTVSIVTTARTYTSTFIKAAGAQSESVSISALCDMTATDTAHVTIAVTGEGGDTNSITGGAGLVTYFCGSLIG